MKIRKLKRKDSLITELLSINAMGTIRRTTRVYPKRHPTQKARSMASTGWNPAKPYACVLMIGYSPTGKRTRIYMRDRGECISQCMKWMNRS